MKFKSILLKKYPSNGILFSKNVIQNILNNQPKVPIRIYSEDEIIGHSEYYKLVDGNLEVGFIIDSGLINTDNLYAVPSGYIYTDDIVNGPDNTRIITKFQLTGISITSYPADTTLKPFTLRTNEEK